MAATPDGKYFVTGSSDNTVALWDAGNQVIIRRMPHGSDVNDVAITSDGQRIVSIGPSGTRVWTANGDLVKEISGTRSLFLSHDDKRIVTTGVFKTWVWSINGDLLQELQHSDLYEHASLSPDGKVLLLTKITDSAITLLNLDGQVLERFSGGMFGGHSGGIDYAAFDPSDANIWTIGRDSTVRKWTLTGKELLSFKIESSIEPRLAFSKMGIVVCANILYVQTSEGGLHPAPDKVSCKRLASTDVGIYVAGYDSVSKITTGGAVPISGAKKNLGSFESVGFSTTGQQVFTTDGFVWNLLRVDRAGSETVQRGLLGRCLYAHELQLLPPSGEPVTLPRPFSKFRCLRVHVSLQSGRILVLWQRDYPDWENRITLHSFDGKLLQEIGQEARGRGTFGFSEDGQRFAISDGTTVKIFSIELKELFRFEVPNTPRMGAFLLGGDSILVGDGLRFEIRSFKGDLKHKLDQLPAAAEAMATSRTGQIALGLVNGSVVLQDGTYRRILPSLGGRVDDLVFSPKGDLLVGRYPNSHLALWRLPGGEAIYLLPDGAVAAPDGRFDVAPDGSARSILFRRPGSNDVVSVESVFDRLYTPGLLNAFVNGAPVKPLDFLHDTIQTGAPVVTLELSQPDENGRIQASVTACQPNAKLRDTYLYHNNALFSLETTRGIRVVSVGNCQTRIFPVMLIPGGNVLRGAAQNEKGIEGLSPQISATFVAQVRRPTQHLILVGIDNYRNPRLQLRYAVKDAQAIRDKLRQKGGRLFDRTEVYELYDAAATRDGISALFKRAARNMRPGDVVVVFFAGHGFSEDRRYYFIPQENPANNEAAIRQGISQEDLTVWISGLPALKKLVILDTCQSGGDWLVGIRGLDEQAALGSLARATGVWIIAASLEQQFAMEASSLGHGLLTASLLEGLDGKARVMQSTTVGGLLPYANQRVPQLARELHKREQFPYTASRGQDFPLGD
jgi:hypothetical protein